MNNRTLALSVLHHASYLADDLLTGIFPSRQTNPLVTPELEFGSVASFSPPLDSLIKGTRVARSLVSTRIF